MAAMKRVLMSRTTRGGVTVAALLALIALPLLSGCGRQTAVEAAAAEGILLVGNGPEPESLDPLFSTGTSALQIQQAIFEGLVVPDPRDLSPLPGVAREWESSADGRTWRFHLREEARWSDGTPVTAEDFVAGWRRFLEPAAGATYASLFYPIRGAEGFHRGETADFATVGIRAVAETLLEVELARPTPYFLGLLAHPAFSPIPRQVIERHGGLLDRANPWTRPPHFVGNGPFVTREWRPQQWVAVRRSETYWDAATVRLEGIRFFAVDDLGAEERMFQAGQLHLTEALPPARLEAWRREDPESLRIEPYLGTYYILLNHRVPPLDDRTVRRSLSAAIDRDLITGRLLGAGQMPTRVFTPTGVAGYRPPDLPEHAVASISPPPEPMRYLFNTSESHRMIAEALAGMWRDSLGLEIRLENTEARTYFARRNAADFTMARGVWIGDYLDPLTFLALWRTGASGSEWTGWSDPTYDGLLAAAEEAPTPQARLERLRDAEARLLEEQVIIPLYHYVTVYLKRPEVTGWYPTLLDWHPWKFVGLEP
jgi:oligopeptide transport system substrate-binding protein